MFVTKSYYAKGLMIFSSFFSEPLFFLAWLFAILYALTVHEFSHALVALLLGDSTAKENGRLTLNPLAHIDVLGFFMLVLIGFGWGKPVPVREEHLRFGRWGSALVSLSGPASNIVSVVLFGVVLTFLGGSLGSGNLLLAFLQFLVLINLILAVFNLLPLPPLDGSKLLFAFFPPRLLHVQLWLERFGPLVLLALILIDGFTPFSILGFLFSYAFRFVGQLF